MLIANQRDWAIRSDVQSAGTCTVGGGTYCQFCGASPRVTEARVPGTCAVSRDVRLCGRLRRCACALTALVGRRALTRRQLPPQFGCTRVDRAALPTPLGLVGAHTRGWLKQPGSNHAQVNSLGGIQALQWALTLGALPQTHTTRHRGRTSVANSHRKARRSRAEGARSTALQSALGREAADHRNLEHTY